MKKIISLLFLCIFLLGYSQQKELSIEDAVLGYSKGLYPSSLSNLLWIDNSNTYTYMRSNELVFTDAKTNKTSKQIVFTELQKTYPNLKSFPRLQNISTTEFTFKSGNTIEIYNYLSNSKSLSISFDKIGQNSDYSSNAKAISYTLDNNLFIATVENPKITVTTIKDKNIVSGQAIHRSEFGIYKGTFWSPEGNYLAFYQKDESNVTNYPLVDVTTYPAALNNIKYPMAGQGSEIAKIGLYNLKTKTTTYLEIDTSDEHYLTNLSWTPDEKYVLVAEINRGQNHVWYNRYSVETGKIVNTLFEEKNDKWTEPEFDAVFLPNSDTNFLWFSERDGFMNLFHYTTDGELVKQLTKFNWVVTGIIGFDHSGKNVFINGTGSDARESHTFQVYFKCM